MFEGGNDTVHTRDEMIFEGSPDGRTTVTYTLDANLSGTAKLAQPLIPALMKKVADGGAEGM